MDMYYMLKNRLGITLEDSLVSELHQQLVIEGNYEAAEEIIDRAHALNVFEPFAQKTRYTLEWKQLWTGKFADQVCICLTATFIANLPQFTQKMKIIDHVPVEDIKCA